MTACPYGHDVIRDCAATSRTALHARTTCQKRAASRSALSVSATIGANSARAAWRHFLGTTNEAIFYQSTSSDTTGAVP